jgi:sialate O-acetylesterase
MLNLLFLITRSRFREVVLAIVSLTSLPIDTSAAELKLANVFSDHMVLQRQKPVPIWGWAQAGDKVTVSFAGQSKTAMPDKDGRWMVKLDPLDADAKPQSLVVSNQDGTKVEVQDVLIGEVWLGSGQSNMAMTVSRSLNFDQEKKAANLPTLRHFREASAAKDAAQSDSSGTWQVCTPETVGGFSATLYFCGRELHRELGVPVGLINSSVGGTPIESWVAREAQLADPTLKADARAAIAAYDKFDQVNADQKHAAAVKRWQEQVREAKKAGSEIPKRPKSAVQDRKSKGGLGGLFNGKISPLIPYAIRGVLWYQGEANSRDKANLYGAQLSLLITDWRRRWDEELPMAWVQLPNFDREGEGWMEVRQQMLETLRLPKTGMAITTDVGDPKDIHPKNKQAVGKRLSLWALGTVYGKDVTTSGPLPKSHEIRGAEVVVTFSHTDGGLVAKDGKLTGFELSDESGKWQEASARIDKDQVIVTSDAVNSPVAVRFAWAANPTCNLYNGAGLPASPFRWQSTGPTK